MRITEQEKAIFISALSSYITPPCQLRLFGSRIDDQAKGGDIDLFLILDNEEHRKKIAFYKADILVQIKDTLGDQKIDLIITTLNSINQSAFLKSAYAESLELYQWS